MKKNINVKAKNSPARKHVRFLRVLEKQAFIAYRTMTRKLIEELRGQLQTEKLMKSDFPKIGTGWTGDVPSINLDLGGKIGQTVSKYMEALRWVFIGDYAGKEAKSMAKKLGFVDKMIPGIMQASYLNSLDMHREHYTFIYDDLPGDIHKYLLEGSLEKIAERTDRYLKQVSQQLENNILHTLDKIIENFNYQNTNITHKKTSKEIAGIEQEEVSDVLGIVTKDLRTEIPKSWFDKEMRTTVNNFRPNWERAVRSELGLSSAAATHQAMHEIYGSNEGSVKVIVLTSKDERVCQFCKHASSHPNGDFKYYKMEDFKPSGWNIGRKRAQWELTIPSFHPNCRCNLVFVPEGFGVDVDGSLTPLKD